MALFRRNRREAIAGRSGSSELDEDTSAAAAVMQVAHLVRDERNGPILYCSTRLRAGWGGQEAIGV